MERHDSPYQSPAPPPTPEAILQRHYATYPLSLGASTHDISAASSPLASTAAALAGYGSPLAREALLQHAADGDASPLRLPSESLASLPPPPGPASRRDTGAIARGLTSKHLRSRARGPAAADPTESVKTAGAPPPLLLHTEGVAVSSGKSAAAATAAAASVAESAEVSPFSTRSSRHALLATPLPPAAGRAAPSVAARSGVGVGGTVTGSGAGAGAGTPLVEPIGLNKVLHLPPLPAHSREALSVCSLAQLKVTRDVMAAQLAAATAGLADMLSAGAALLVARDEAQAAITAATARGAAARHEGLVSEPPPDEVIQRRLQKELQSHEAPPPLPPRSTLPQPLVTAPVPIAEHEQQEGSLSVAGFDGASAGGGGGGSGVVAAVGAPGVTAALAPPPSPAKRKSAAAALPAPASAEPAAVLSTQQKRKSAAAAPAAAAAASTPSMSIFKRLVGGRSRQQAADASVNMNEATSTEDSQAQGASASTAAPLPLERERESIASVRPDLLTEPSQAASSPAADLSAVHTVEPSPDVSVIPPPVAAASNAAEKSAAVATNPAPAVAAAPSKPATVPVVSDSQAAAPLSVAPVSAESSQAVTSEVLGTIPAPDASSSVTPAVVLKRSSGASGAQAAAASVGAASSSIFKRLAMTGKAKQQYDAHAAATAGSARPS